MANTSKAIYSSFHGRSGTRWSDQVDSVKPFVAEPSRGQVGFGRPARAEYHSKNQE